MGKTKERQSIYNKMIVWFTVGYIIYCISSRFPLFLKTNHNILVYKIDSEGKKKINKIKFFNFFKINTCCSRAHTQFNFTNS